VLADVVFGCQLFSKALVVTRQCLKFANSCGDDCGILSFLDSISAVLRKSLCGVDWNLRDTAVEFINGTFLAGFCCLLCGMFVVVISVRTGPGPGLLCSNIAFTVTINHNEVFVKYLTKIPLKIGQRR